jgi:nickel/cobalt transporter (NiCoT) family protein
MHNGKQPSKVMEAWRSLGAKERASVLGMAGFVGFLNLLGWGLLLGVIAPHHYHVSSTQVFGIGLGITAYTLGMRHAFDADHIAAIDNTTRKLMADGKRPLSVGFWFSLGHSSVVFIMVALLAFGVRSLATNLGNNSSDLHKITTLVGTTVSGVFLLIIGILNLVVLKQILGVFGRMKKGEFDSEALEDHLDNRGFLNRFLGRVTRAVTKSWHMYPVGLLFGLGFDTVTEVGLLVIAGGAAAFALPWYAILTLPILFAAGMSLLDTIDGCFMNFAYGWAFSKPVRKVYYNIAITGLSVAVALIIGSIEIISIFTDKLNITSGPIHWIGSLDMNNVGFAIVGLFVLTWIVALAVWHFGNIEEKWETGLVGVSPKTEARLEHSMDMTLDQDLGVQVAGEPA